MSKRIPDGYSELSVIVPKDMKIAFKVYCAKREITMSEVVKDLIDNWLKEQGENYR